MFSVVYHPEAREEATALPVKIRVKFDRLIGKLEYDARWHCCKVSDEAAFCLIQRPYISKTLLTRRISPRGSP